jgi:hypothetical protein
MIIGKREVSAHKMRSLADRIPHSSDFLIVLACLSRDNKRFFALANIDR